MSKILIASTYFYPYISGLSLYPFRLGKKLAQRKHRVTVLTFQYQKNLPSEEIVNNIKVYRLKPHLSLAKGLINWLYPFYALKQVIANEQIVVSCPGPENFWVSLWARLLRKRLIVLYLCDLELKHPWYYLLASKAANIASFFCCFLADKIVTSAETYAKSSPVLKHFGRKISYHYPLTDSKKPNLFFLQQLKKTYPRSTPIIGFVGRFSQEKNLETLLYALDNLKKKYPKLLFICAGPYSFQVVGEKNYYRRIQNLLEELGLNYAILGILTETELAAFYRFIDLLVLPSNNRTEAFGMVQVEAMEQGTPVVAANSPGIAEVIKLTNAGALFAANNIKDLENKIKLVVQHKRLYKKQAKTAFHKLKLAESTRKLLALFNR